MVGEQLLNEVLLNEVEADFFSRDFRNILLPPGSLCLEAPAGLGVCPHPERR